MSGHEKKARPVRVSGSSKSPIATPPRAALHGRAKADNATNTAATSESSVNATGSINAASNGTNGTGSDTESGGSPSVKDKRIEELEKDIAIMTDEFSRELTQLSHKLTNESETSIFWQQKHSTLNQTFLKTDTDLRLLRQEIGTFQQTREERDRDIKTRISSLILDRDAFREAFNEAMHELKAKEEGLLELQDQIRGLKSFVSTNSKMDEQVADEFFGERMQRLGNMLQNWVITNFRRVKIDVEKVPEDIRDELSQLVPTYENLASSSKVHLIQSFVSRLLVNKVFDEYFVGLSQEDSEQLRKTEDCLSKFGPAEGMNQWRSNTLAIMKKDPSQTLETPTQVLVEKVVKNVDRIISAISDVQPSETRDQSLRLLINDSIELSRLLRVQRAVFTISMPSIEDHQQTMFDPRSMEDIGGEDEDSLFDREIACVTFPGIVKSGDENGERAHLKNVVSKIRVLCAPDG